MGEGNNENPQSCPAKPRRDPETIRVLPGASVADYREAMALAGREASARLGDCMLVSWYDRDRDFEAPQHVSECERDGAVPGYVEYALSRNASLKIDVENGRFVFFYLALDF